MPFTVRHRVDFDECPHTALAVATVLKLRVARNFVTYDATEKIIRYAMTSKVSAVNGRHPKKKTKRQRHEGHER